MWRRPSWDDLYARIRIHIEIRIARMLASPACAIWLIAASHHAVVLPVF